MTNEEIGLGSERYSGITNEAIGLGSPKLHGGSNDAIGLYQSSFNTKYSNITEQEIKNSLYGANIECEKWKSLLRSCIIGKAGNRLYRCAKDKNQGYKKSYLQSQINKCKTEIAGLNRALADLKAGVSPDLVADTVPGYIPPVDDTTPVDDTNGDGPPTKPEISTNTILLIVGALFILLIGGALIFRQKPASIKA